VHRGHIGSVAEKGAGDGEKVAQLVARGRRPVVAGSLEGGFVVAGKALQLGFVELGSQPVRARVLELAEQLTGAGAAA